MLYLLFRSAYSISPVPSETIFAKESTLKHYITGSSVNVEGVVFKQDNSGLLPYFDTTSIESVPSSAHGGLEITLTIEKSGTSFLRLRLISINIVKHLASLMHLEQYPQYFNVNEKTQ